MAGLISAAGSIAGSFIGGQQQASGQEAAAQTQKDMFNAIRAQEQPFIQSGYGAANMLDYLLGIGGAPGATGGGQGGSMAVGPFFSGAGGPNKNAPSTPGFQTSLPAGYLTQQFDPSQVANSPAFQFSLETGGQALRNADTPGLGALSGAALKDLVNFNQGTAQSYYNNYFNQFQTQQNNVFNRLMGLSTLGQNAAGNLGSQGATLGTGIAQAQAAAAGSLGASYSSAFNNLGGGLSTYFNNQNNDTNMSLQQAEASLSDRRLKENIQPVGFLHNGLTVYSYNFIGSPKTEIGLMADEVEKLHPEAVKQYEDGFMRVNYFKAVQ